MSEPFNPKRLTVARKRRGFTKSSLAREMQVSLRMVTAYERGEKEPRLPNLAKMADVLRFPVEFFSGPDLEEPPVEASSFRALSAMTAMERGQAFGSGTLALALSDWIEARFSLPEPSLPNLRGIDDIEAAAMAVRGEWGLGQRPIRNMIHLLEAHGVRVFSLVEECRSFDAFSFWRGDVPYLFLNTVKSAERSRMDAAHELGHLVLHWREGLRGREAETEAQRFASFFLMPTSDIVAQAPRRNCRVSDIIKAKQRWNVAAAALAYRMHKVGLLSEWQYRTVFVEISRMGYRTSEPESSKPEVSKVFAKVFAALRAEGTTLVDVARELYILPEELEQLVFGLVLTPIEGSQNIARQDSQRPQLRLI